MFFYRRCWAGLMACVMSGILAVSWSSPAPAQTHPENLESIREEFQVLAAYMSMDRLLDLETLDAAKTADKLARIENYSTRRFHSHPLLEKVGQQQMQHLIKREQRIVPVYKPQDLTLADVVLGGISKINEQNVLRQWRLEDDARDRDSYEAVMPIVRMLAGPPGEGNEKRVTVRADHDALTVRHRFPTKLTNVTLFATFSGIPAQKSTAYYFDEEWKANTDLTLRIPYERSHFGVSGVLALDLDIYSDEHTIPRHRVDFPDHLPAAVKSALAQARAIVRSSPAESFDLVKGIQRNASGDLYSFEDLKAIQTEAKRAASEQTTQLNQRLFTLKNELANQKGLQRSDRSKKALYDALIRDTESRIDSVEQSIKTLRRVR